MPAPTIRVGTRVPLSKPPSPFSVTRRIAADRERAAHREDLVAGEVPERVRDQAAVVPLHPAQHVRAAADDEVGARLDHRVREGDARCPGSRRGTSPSPGERACVPEPSAPACMVTTTTSALAAAFSTRRRAAGIFVSDCAHGYGREADERDLDVADLLVRDLAGPARRREAAACAAPRASASAPDGPVVERVVVGEVEDREAGPLQPARRTRAASGTRSSSSCPRRTSRSRPSRACPRGCRARRPRRDRSATPSKNERPPSGGHVRRRAHHDVADGGDRDDALRSGAPALAAAVCAAAFCAAARRPPSPRAPAAATRAATGRGGTVDEQARRQTRAHDDAPARRSTPAAARPVARKALRAPRSASLARRSRTSCGCRKR